MERSATGIIIILGYRMNRFPSSRQTWRMRCGFVGLCRTVGLKMCGCMFVYFAHDFDRMLFVFIKIRVCVFVRLRLWEGGCQFGLFWGHSDARVRHIQTLPGLPYYHNSSHHKSQRRKSAPQTPHYQLYHTKIQDQISNPKPKKHNFRGTHEQS